MDRCLNHRIDLYDPFPTLEGGAPCGKSIIYSTIPQRESGKTYGPVLVRCFLHSLSESSSPKRLFQLDLATLVRGESQSTEERGTAAPL